MSLQAYLEASPRGLSPSYSLPSGEEKIMCDFCLSEAAHEVRDSEIEPDIVIGIGSQWYCGYHYDLAKTVWNPGRGR